MINRAALEGPVETLSGRRRRSRLRVRLAAQLATRSEAHQAILADISLDGARIQTEVPIVPGTEILIEWAGFEAFGDVVWCKDGQCGIVFEEPIARPILLATRAVHDAARLPDDRNLLRRIASQWVRGNRRL